MPRVNAAALRGHLVGYASTSTTDQKVGLAAQQRDLKAAGCLKVFHEELSSVAAKRPQLDAALDYVREGTLSSLPSPTGWPARRLTCCRSPRDWKARA